MQMMLVGTPRIDSLIALELLGANRQQHAGGWRVVTAYLPRPGRHLVDWIAIVRLKGGQSVYWWVVLN